MVVPCDSESYAMYMYTYLYDMTFTTPVLGLTIPASILIPANDIDSRRDPYQRLHKPPILEVQNTAAS